MIMLKNKSLAFLAVLIFGIFLAHGCNSSDSSVQGSIDDTTGDTTGDAATTLSEAYPTSLAVASPFETVSGASLKSSAKSFSSAYSSSITRISTILSGSSIGSCSFDGQNFLAKSSRAECYGPTVLYENYPAAVTSSSGSLPQGDLGLWLEAEPSTGEACAAAELNQQMEGTSNQALAAMTAVASTICTANVNGVWPPAAGSSIDLLTLPTPLSAPNVTFSSATVGLDSTGDIWSYDLTFAYTDTSSVSHDIEVHLSHQDGSGVQSGRFTYMVDDDFPAGNCPSSDATTNGSLVYEIDSTSIELQSKVGVFCGNGASGIGPDGTVDPSYTYPAYPDGWGNNFEIFTANFDPTDLSGSYSYRWQAGPNDSNSRVFNIGVNSTTPMDGEAWFGYGDPVTSTDECIKGFYCNWAGPTATHDFVSTYAQRQFVTLNSTTGIVEATGSDIAYAPTNSCTYDGSGSFVYDRDVDGDLTDETASTIVVTDPVSSGLLLDLYSAIDVNLDGTATMCETIESRGFSSPMAPVYSNSYTGSMHP